MYTYNRKKEIIKNTVYIGFILLIAIVSTYYIYDKFSMDRNIDFNSESLDVTYHESTGDKLNISKITPVTDSVGLSSKSYNLTVKNNLTEKINYKIKIVDDLDLIADHGCDVNSIPKEDIRISIKVKRNDNIIYTLSDLEKGILLDEEIAALDKVDIAIRVWIKQDSTLPVGSDMHYHGLIQVVEEDSKVAINR